jgi:glycosyltransferase involved in cell wall biosynthesis
MKVLIISSKPPYPKIDGGCIATAELVEGLLMNKQNEIHFFTLTTQKHPFHPLCFPNHWKNRVHLQSCEVNTQIRFAKAMAFLFSRNSYLTRRFYNKTAATKLNEYVVKHDFDIVQLEGVFLFAYFSELRKTSKAKFVFRSHNIEFQLLQQRAKQFRFLKRFYLKIQVNKLKREEFFLLNNCHGAVCISKVSKSFFETNSKNKDIIYIPTGFPQNDFCYTPKKSFFHLAAMDWPPNIQSLNWLITNVWTDFNPNINLHIAGKALGKNVHFSQENIVNHGEIEKSDYFMQQYGIMLVPLFTGSGLRIKIIEAGSYGIPIIATEKAVEGIGLQKNVDYLEANTAEEFKECMNLLLENTALQVKIATSIKKNIAQNYHPQKLSEQLFEFYKSI